MSVKLDRNLLVIYRNEIKKNSKICSKYYCEECQLILIEPHQTDCGIRYCKICINNWIDKCIKQCPGCKNKISSIDNIFRYDKAIEKEIFDLNINCINEKCEKIVKFKDLLQHLGICEFKKITCECCNELILFSEKEFHLENQCKKKLIKCSHCEIEMVRDELENLHQNINSINVEKLCEKLESNCPNKCSSEIFYNIKSHLENSCPNRQVKCTFTKYGCEKYLTENQLQVHIKDELNFHMKLLVNCIKEIKNERTLIQSKSKQQQNYFLSEIDELKSFSLQVNQTISNYSKTFFKEKDDILKIKSEFQTLKDVIKIRKFKNQSLSLNQNLPFGNGSDNLIISSNGSVTWTIKDIRRKIENAKNNIDTQILSEPFYTNRPGYKIMLKVFPNGDGIAKNKFLSVFFLIIKGEFDEELSWPFSKKISLSLIKNEIEIFATKIVMKPQNNTACYGKPINNYNIGSGHPEFVKIQDIIHAGKYTENGNLIVKLSIDS